MRIVALARSDFRVSAGIYRVSPPRQLSIIALSSRGRDGPGPFTKEKSMLELYLRSAHGLARARSSLVGSYLDDFAAALHEIGYCRRIGAWCISYAVHLGLWAAAEGVCIGALDEGAVSAFLAHLPRCRCPGQRAGLHAVAHSRTQVFVQYLRTAGVVPVPVQEVVTPALVTEFCEWMRRQRGVADTTLRQYRHVAIALIQHIGNDP